MERSEFEKLIAESGLQLVHSLGYEPRFIVRLYAETLLVMENKGIHCLINSERVQYDTLGFDEDENVPPWQAFQNMTIDQARAYISAREQELKRAAKTQSGEVHYPDSPRPTPTKKSTTIHIRTVNYPAH